MLSIEDIQSATVSALQQNIGEEAIVDNQQLLASKQAEAIDAYFRERNMPLAGYGKKMVEVANKYDIDWTLIPAIAIRESTGGINACKSVPNSPFGWGSCKIGFKTMDDAIESLGRNISGNNPKTAHHYEGKDVKGILQTYNPPHVVAKYAPQVMSIMESIRSNIEA
jgi:hypothetical protein